MEDFDCAYLLGLFRAGMDTWDLRRHTGLHEALILRMLDRARENERAQKAARKQIPA